MIIYQVSCKVNIDVAAKWEAYFIEQHLDDVLNTGCFTGYDFRKEKLDEENILFSSEYYCESEADLERYNTTFAAALKADINSKFGGYYDCHRHIYQSIISKKA